jgi:hypothetical protein
MRTYGVRVAADTDDELELDPTPCTAAVVVSVWVNELGPNASAVASARAELPVIDTSMLMLKLILLAPPVTASICVLVSNVGWSLSPATTASAACAAPAAAAKPARAKTLVRVLFMRLHPHQFPHLGAEGVPGELEFREISPSGDIPPGSEHDALDTRIVAVPTTRNKRCMGRAAVHMILPKQYSRDTPKAVLTGTAWWPFRLFILAHLPVSLPTPPEPWQIMRARSWLMSTAEDH